MKKFSIITLSFWMLLLSLKLTGADFYGPAPFVDILNRSFSKSWTPQAISTIENRAHVLILDAATQQYCLSVTSGTMSGVEVVAVSSLNDSSGTYGKVLRSIFQMQDLAIETLASNSLSGEYTLRPELMVYYGIDSNSSSGSSTASSLQISRIKGVDLSDYSETGYLAFSFSGTPSSCLAQVTKRYILNSSTALEQDTSWSSNQWLKIGANGVELVSSQADATNLMLANALDLIDFSNAAGEAFNPTSNPWQTNAFAAWPSKNGVVEVTAIAQSTLNELQNGTAGDNIDSQYRQQFGTSSDATAVASAYLDQIEAALNDANESLRYPKQLYLTARANMLSHTFGAVDEVNAELDKSTVPFIYFTNAKDDSDVYHPFMVVGTRNGTGGPNFLIDVARPPGDGISGSYEDQTVTRNATLSSALFRIPLKNYGLTSKLDDNDLSSYNSLALDAGLSSSEYDVYNYASYSVCGLTMDGVKIYPAYNNTLAFTPMNGEITSTGVHVGRGMGLHYHADGHSFNGNGINLYNIEDYVGKQHPPIIGFGLDGIAIYGKYESNYSSMDGYSVALDEYGGHDHDDYGYHYHAFPKAVSSSSKGVNYDFTQHFLMVGAYRGNINNIPDFQNGGTNQLKDNELARYVGLDGTYVTTNFATATQHTVTVTVANSTGGSVSGSGTYDYNTAASIAATPSSDYDFSGWSGDASGSTNPLSLTMTQDFNITASFTPVDTTYYTISVVNPTGGTISGGGAYGSGTIVNITATPANGYAFVEWSGGLSGSTNPYVLTTSEDLNVTASFQANLWSNASSLGSSWYSLADSFGIYYQSDQTWIYHFGMGWLYPASETTDSVWLYKVGRGWMYMKTSDFPHIWDASTSNWVYYAENNGQPSLYEYANTAWVTLD